MPTAAGSGGTDFGADAATSRLVFCVTSRRILRGATVLVGDPGRGHLPMDRYQAVATYRTAEVAAFSDSQIEQVQVLALSSQI